MFSCIFFPEDSSLSVVGKADKKLTISNEWKVEESLNMKWGKRVYKGTIVRISGKFLYHIYSSKNLLVELDTL